MAIKEGHFDPDLTRSGRWMSTPLTKTVQGDGPDPEHAADNEVSSSSSSDSSAEASFDLGALSAGDVIFAIHVVSGVVHKVSDD
eukprot:6458573-Amphidinium_carterae.1